MLQSRYLRLFCSSRTFLPSVELTCLHLFNDPVTCATRCKYSILLKQDRRHFDANLPSHRKARLLFYNTGVNYMRNICTSQVKLNCWNCKQPLDNTPAFFCVSCKVVQPPEEGASYFQIMGCDCTFSVDIQKLQKTYLQLQRSLHPDNFTPEIYCRKRRFENQSALVNKAYQTLLRAFGRGLYMLELRGMHIEEGTDPGADSDFLIELMEINEALERAKSSEEASKIGRDAKEKVAELTEEIDAALRKGELQAAKALLAEMNYFANIEEKVKEKLSEFM
ncbi:LOW QUALITY PROTEIN: iron-sulfur cluster co-chaperone protein HscB [Thalassophryne amazonica]|uniref:LOW QUALITY PROTEIN: iron-sulfur cluster co-chaperone protein HscB n=1 Tax=Thalassophryne amazonica TaxID=390379 RepID=UPI0014716CBB|nr:LOW QUALITY PROTEIN: iron-sulfur cluster co-chaperone protein HscB [Thalassophryne amazonica]